MRFILIFIFFFLLVSITLTELYLNYVGLGDPVRYDSNTLRLRTKRKPKKEFAV